MRKTMKAGKGARFLAGCLCGVMALTMCPVMPRADVSSPIHVYEDTPGDVRSDKYILTANGTEVPAVRYQANGNNFDIARFASDDQTPEFTVQVPNEEINSVSVYPQRYYSQESLQVSEDRHSVTFKMSDRLRYAIVMINGGPADQAGKPYLAIINDPQETDKPDIHASNVLNAQTYIEEYLAVHPNSEVQKAVPAGTTSGGVEYEAGNLLANNASQVRFPDQRTMTEDDATYALQSALDEIYKEGSAYDTLYFPAGEYTYSGLEIRDRNGKHVDIYVEEGALLKNRLQECMQAMEPAIGIWDSSDITISGRGIFDGNGVENYRKDRHDAKDSCHQGGVMVVRSENITFNDTYIRDAKQWNWESHGSKNCTFNNIKGLTPYNQPWVDGLDMASAQDLTINGALTLGNDDCFASGHYNPSDGFPNTVPGYDEYNADSLLWDTEDSKNVVVQDTLGWSYAGGNGIRLGHNTYGHKMVDYTFDNLNAVNFTGGGNGITVQNGRNNGSPYPGYEMLTFTDCSFDTTRVGTNMNINGLNGDTQIQNVTLNGCWFSNENAGSGISNVADLQIKDLFIGGGKVSVSNQAKLSINNVTNFDKDWADNHAPKFTSPEESSLTVYDGDQVFFTLSASDEDEGDNITLAADEETMPKGAAFDPQTGAFIWTPSLEEIGKYDVVFQASDAYETTTKTIHIEVKSSQMREVTVNVSEDASVKAWKTEKQNNYGGQDYIRTYRMKESINDEAGLGKFGEKAGNSTGDGRDAKISFIKFDASELRKNAEGLEKAELILTYIGKRENSVKGDDTLFAAAVPSDWSESDITWNTMPEFDTSAVKESEVFQVDNRNVLMAQDEKYNENQTIDGTKVSVDITDYVKALTDDDKYLSLAVCDSKGYELAFVSKEGAGNMANASEDMQPAVVLTVMSPPVINGPKQMTVQEGYEDTVSETFNFRGAQPVTVEKVSGSGKITWNNDTKTLDIQAGLEAGEHQVVLRASNGAGQTEHIFILTVEKTAAELTGLELNTENVKTQYKLGEDFDGSGLVAEAVYSDGSRRTLEPGEYSVEGFTSDTMGPKQITVSYTENDVIKTAVYTVQVSMDLDTKALEMAMTMAQKLAEGSDAFTAESFAAVQAALEAAEAILNDPEAVQEDVDAAFEELLEACTSLVPGVQKAGLKAAMDGAAELLADPETAKRYTQESIDAVQAAYDKAAEIYDKDYDENLEEGQQIINEATTSLIAAVTQMLDKDFARLYDLVAQAEKILEEQDKYTAESVRNLTAAVNAAKERASDTAVTKDEIKAAYTELASAITSLQYKGNKAELKSAIENAENILENADKYLASSLEGLSEELDAAKAVYRDDNVLQEAVSEAVARLVSQCLKARMLGDVDGNGQVNTADSSLLLKYMAEKTELEEIQIQAADVNADGKSDTTDASVILKLAAEKINTF